MIRNLGGIEQTIRIVLGVILIAVGYLAGLPLAGAIAAYAVGVIALLTGAIGFCPAWKLFGINTGPEKAPGQS